MILRTLALITVFGAFSISNTIGQATGNHIHGKPNFKNPRHAGQVAKPKSTMLQVKEPQSSNVILEADVMINVKASSYVAIFAVTQEGKSVPSTDSIMNSRLNTFMTGLKALNIPEKNVHVDFISLLPTYGVEFKNKKLSNEANEVSTGFQMKKNIHVIFEKHQDLDGIITSAANAEIYDVVKVDYNVENIRSAYDTLRAEATRIIAEKRKIYKDMGLKTTVMNLSEGYDVSYPMERYDGYMAYYTGNAHQKAEALNPNVKIKDSDKVETIFYNKIPYNQFDMVINADSVEPMVQFYYKLKVRYSVAPQPIDLAAEHALTRNH